MRTLAFLTTLYLCGLPLIAQSQSWVDVHSIPGGTYLQLDTDSVARLGPDSFAATWQMGPAPGQAYFVKQGVLSCKIESVTLSRAKNIQTNPGAHQIGLGVTETDYVDGVYRQGNSARELSIAEMRTRHQFPSGNQPEGVLLKHICQTMHGLPQNHRDSVERHRVGMRCGQNPNEDLFDCSEEPLAKESLRSLFQRQKQVEVLCQVDASRLNRLVVHWLTKADDCQNKPDGCGAEVLTRYLSGLGDDLASAVSSASITINNSCPTLDRYLDDADKEQARTAALRKFRKCLDKAIPELDDKLSPADVIADATYGMCRNELPADLVPNNKFKDNIKPRITAQVLKARRQASSELAKPTAKPSPRVAPRPDTMPAAKPPARL